MEELLLSLCAKWPADCLIDSLVADVDLYKYLQVQAAVLHLQGGILRHVRQHEARIPPWFTDAGRNGDKYLNCSILANEGSSWLHQLGYGKGAVEAGIGKNTTDVSQETSPFNQHATIFQEERLIR